MGGKKKKPTGPPPVFATSSVKSKKNIEDEAKAIEKAKEEEELRKEHERLAAEEAAKKALLGDDADSKTQQGTGNDKGGRNAAGHQQPGDRANAGLLSVEELYAQRETEEIAKLESGTNSRLQRGTHLRPAGAVTLSSELEAGLFRFFLEQGENLNGKSRTEVNSAVVVTPTSGCTDVRTFDPIVRSLYFPDAYRIKKMTYEKLSAVYQELQDLGFADDLIEKGMRATYGYDHRAATEYLTLYSEFLLASKQETAEEGGGNKDSGGVSSSAESSGATTAPLAPETTSDTVASAATTAVKMQSEQEPLVTTTPRFLPAALQSDEERTAFTAFERRRKQLEAEELERKVAEERAARRRAQQEAARKKREAKRLEKESCAKQWILDNVSSEEENINDGGGQGPGQQQPSKAVDEQGNDVEEEDMEDVDDDEIEIEPDMLNDEAGTTADQEDVELPDLFGDGEQQEEAGVVVSELGHVPTTESKTATPASTSVVATGAAAALVSAAASDVSKQPDPEVRKVPIKPLPKKLLQQKQFPQKENLFIHNSWTGKTPAQVLDNLVAKQLGKQHLTKKSVNKLGVGRVQIVCGSSVVHDLEVPFRCKKKKDAIELVSTFVLFHLQYGSDSATPMLNNVQELLPPAFKSFYNDMVRKREQERLEAARMRIRPRVKLCLELCGEASVEGLEKFLGNGEFAAGVSSEAGATGNMIQPSPGSMSELKDFSVSRPVFFSAEKVAGKTKGREGSATKKSSDTIEEAPQESEEEFQPAVTSVKQKDKKKIDQELAEYFVSNHERRHNLQRQRSELPVAEFKEEIISMVNSHRVSVVSGSTGSGKTTQVPQYILEHALLELYNKENTTSDDSDPQDKPLPTILVTEPRRISAMSVAQRVAQEMGEHSCGSGLVGYQIRLEKKAHPVKCRLLFCTIGVLLQRLKHDPYLQNVTHVFVDEVHERTAESDLALLLLKRQLPRSKLNLCLMSATADSEKLINYFHGLSMATKEDDRGVDVSSPVVSPRGIQLGLEGPCASENGSAKKKTAISRKDKPAADEDDWDNDDDEDEDGEENTNRAAMSQNPSASPTEMAQDWSRSAELCRVGFVSVPGRIFPVQEFFLEDVVEQTEFQLSEQERDFAAKWYHSKNYGKQTTNNLLDDDEQTESMKADVKLPDTSGKDKYGQKILYSPKTVETLQFMDHSAINYELIEETLRWIERLSTQEKIARHEGAVLVFLPGMPEISRCLNHLYSTEWFGDESEFTILSLHSQLSDQKTAFQPAAKGKRKIVLSTNIAETGVTIPDIVFVVDAGKVKQNSYHEASNTSSLKEVFVSRAEAIQRKGRAGRVRSGFCFRLYTKRRFDKNFLPAPVPELLRCSLTEPMLSVLVAGFQPTLFRDALDAPPDQRITQALLLLCDVGCAFSSNTTSQMTAALIANYLQNYTGNAQLASNNLQFQITPLGLALAKLPVDIRLGKMLLLGKIFGGSEYLLNTVSALSIASSNRVYLEFMDDAKKQQAKQKQESFYEKLCGKFNGAIVSDHLALAELLRDFEKLGEVKPQEVIDKEDDQKNSSANTGKSYQKESLRQAQERFARSYFVNKSALLQMADVKEDLRGKLEMTTAKSCKGSNSISAQNYEPTTAQLVKKDRPVLAACLVAAGLRPNIARMEHASAMPSTGKGGGKQDGSSNWSLVISAGNEQNIRLHPHSSFLHQSRFLQNQHRWLSYYAKVKTSSLYLRDATVITNPIWFLLFHSEEWDLYPTQRCIVFNNHYTGLGPTSSNSATSNARDWQCVSIAPSTAVILRQLKMRFARVFREWVRSTVSEKGAAGGSSSSSSPYANGQLSPDADRLVTMVKKIIEAKPPTTLSF